MNRKEIAEVYYTQEVKRLNEEISDLREFVDKQWASAVFAHDEQYCCRCRIVTKDLRCESCRNTTVKVFLTTEPPPKDEDDNSVSPGK